MFRRKGDLPGSFALPAIGIIREAPNYWPLPPALMLLGVHQALLHSLK